MGFTTDHAPLCPHLGTLQHPLALPGTPQVPSSGCTGLSPALHLILDLQIIQVTASGLFALPVLLLFKNLQPLSSENNPQALSEHGKEKQGRFPLKFRVSFNNVARYRLPLFCFIACVLLFGGYIQK